MTRTRQADDTTPRLGKAPSTIVEAMMSAIRTGDMEGAAALIHPQVVIDEPRSLFYGGVHHGLAGFWTGVLGAINERAIFDIHGVEVSDLDDQTALLKLDLTLTSRETGRSLRTPYIELHRVVDGLIIGIDVFPKDTQAIMALFPHSGLGQQLE